MRAEGFFHEVFSFESLEKINKLFTGLGLVHIVKIFHYTGLPADLGLENAARGRSIFKTSVTVFHYAGLPAGK